MLIGAASAIIPACSKGTRDVSDKETKDDNVVVLPHAKRRHLTGATRTARWRDRRQRGFRVYQVEVCDADIKALIAKNLLDRLDRHDPNAIERAIGVLLDRL
jgi:hypothetical protein